MIKILFNLRNFILRLLNNSVLFSVLVGAGSAGAVIANRLSENPYHKVLLLEAGGDENEVSDVPALAAYLQLSPMDWKYKTEPQDSACLAMAGKVSHVFWIDFIYATII